MANLHYSITINAPKEKVWHTMLDPDTYRLWTAVFHEGSYYEGSWEKGRDIRFIAEDDGGASGMMSRIAENIPYEFVSIEHVGEIVDGKVDTESDRAKQWIGALENYRFSEKDGVTKVDVEMIGPEVSPEMAEMFDGMWPDALQKLKQLAEQ